MLCSSLHVDRISLKFLLHPTLLTPILLKYQLREGPHYTGDDESDENKGI